MSQWPRLFMALLLVGAMVGIGGLSHGDARNASSPLAVATDHVFTNAQYQAGAPAYPINSRGPKVLAAELSPSWVAIQGQVMTVSLEFSHADNDLTAPKLWVRVFGRDEYWLLGKDQFGAIMGTNAVVRLELSPFFEPDAYILEFALQDDNGRIGAVFSRALVVTPYITPEIASFVPQDGDTDVPLNAAVRGLFSAAVVGDPPTLTLTQDSAPVPASIQLLPNMKGITLIPNSFLLPQTTYAATLTVGDLLTGDAHQQTNHFTTGPHAPAPDIKNRVYAILLAPEYIVEPAGAELIFTVAPIPPLLFKIVRFDEVAQDIGSIAALGTGDPLQQNLDAPLISFPGAGAYLENPYFRMGPSLLTIDLGGLSGGLFDVTITVHDYTLSGRFSPTGDAMEQGMVTGYLDAQEINDAFNQIVSSPIPFDLCNFLPDACDPQGHLPFRAENIAGPWQPQNNDFFDLTLAVNPTQVTGSVNSTVAVSGQYLINAIATGPKTITLSTNYGRFPCGAATCSVSAAAGAYLSTLTIPRVRPAGQTVIVTATTTCATGTITRTVPITVK